MSVDKALSNKTKAFLLGTAVYPKDEQLQDIPNISYNVQAIHEALGKQDALGIADSDIHEFINIKDNTKIKEELARASEKAKHMLIVYLGGYVVYRKEQLYLASSSSSRDKIHLNGIPFSDIIAILEESEVKNKILFLDACFLDSKDEDVDESGSLDLLNAYANNESNICIISTSPGMGLQAYLGYTDSTIFTQALTEVLRVGMPLESPTLTLSNVREGITEYLAEQGLRFPPVGTHPAQEEIIFCKNTRYTTFHDLKIEGDRFFDEGIYQEALKAYKQAGVLMPSNAEVDNKRRFIRLMLKGIAAGQQRLEDARDAFVEAQGLLDLPVIRDKIVETLLAIASKHFQLENYEEAKAHYKSILGWKADHEFAQQRLKACSEEIAFLDYMEEADRLYFDDSFEKALELYEQALKIHPDRKAQRRKSECERLLEKEALLREKLSAEIAASEASKAAEAMEQHTVEELKKKVEAELRPALGEQLRKELRSEISKEVNVAYEKSVKEAAEARAKQLAEESKQAMKKEMAEGFEEDFWTNALLTNQLEVYKFYLQFFPRPKYAEKAKGRIQDIKNQEAEAQRQAAKAKPEIIEEPSQEVEPQALEDAQIANAEESRTEESRTEESRTEESSAEEANDGSELKHESPHDVLSRLEAAFNGQGALKNGSHKARQEEDAEHTSEELPLPDEMSAAIQEELSKEQPRAADEKPKAEEKAGYTEEELWDKACNENTLEGYQFYVENTIDATHLVDAYYQINRMSKEKEAAASAAATEERNSNSVESRDSEEPSQKAEAATEEAPIDAEEAPAPEEAVDSEDKAAQQATAEEIETKEVAVEEEGHSQYFRAHGEPSYEDEEEEEPKGQASIEEQKLWDATIQSNTISSYYDYISQSQDKHFLSEAKKRIQELKGQAKKSEQGDWEDAYAANSVDALKSYIRKYPLGDFYAKAMFRISELEAEKS